MTFRSAVSWSMLTVVLVALPGVRPAPGVAAAAGAPLPAFADELRLSGPAALEPDGVALYRVEARHIGETEWKRVPEGALAVRVSGQALFVEDPCARPVNPFAITALGSSTGTATLVCAAAGLTNERVVRVGPVAQPAGAFAAQIRADRPLHRYTGLGAGVMFYDNQWDITTTYDLYNWCFRDVRARYLRLLLRPDYEPENDNRDEKAIREDAFDFSTLERPIRIARAALERNPGLQVHAQLYSPPAWLKAGGDTSGRTGLKTGRTSAAEMAEYVFAALRHLKRRGVEVQYLSLFNEPDWKHEQTGMYVPDLGDLATLFRDCTAALEALAAQDAELKTLPKLVFPDSLGAGSLTRAGAQTDRLKAQAALFDRAGVWGVHDYWNQPGYRPVRFAELRALPPVAGKPVWMTEWAQRDALGDPASGVEYGREILNALRLGAEAWMAFEWCHPAGSQSGLISCDWSARKPRARYWRSKAYHVFRQIANLTPVDGRVLQADTRLTAPGVPPEAVESLAVAGKDAIIFHMQNTHFEPVGFRVFWPTPSAAGVEAMVTDPTRDGVELPTAKFGISDPVRGYASVAGTLPPWGLMTLKLPVAASAP